MDRETIHKIVDSERDYQLKMEDLDGQHIVSTLNMGGILTAIDYNLNKAKDAWYNEVEPYENTTVFIRKIAALCIKAGEDYGMTKR